MRKHTTSFIKCCLVPSGTFLCNFTFSNSKSILNSQFVDFKSGIEKLSKIIDNNRMAAKCQGLTTDYMYFLNHEKGL